MYIKTLSSKLELLIKSRNLSFVFAVAMMISNIMLVTMFLFKSDRVIITPAYLSSSVWLEYGSVSKSYLEEMSLFFAYLILDVSPNSAEYKRNLILSHVDPSFYNILKKRLIDESGRMLKDQVSTSFKPISIEAYPDTMIAKLTGDLVTYVGSKHLFSSRSTYAMKFNYKNGKLLLKLFDSSLESK